MLTLCVCGHAYERHVFGRPCSICFTCLMFTAVTEKMWEPKKVVRK